MAAQAANAVTGGTVDVWVLRGSGSPQMVKSQSRASTQQVGVCGDAPLLLTHWASLVGLVFEKH